MKAYIGMIDWVFCYSVYEEEAFDCMYKLFKVLVDLEALPEIWEPYWGTNQSFYFDNHEIEELLNTSNSFFIITTENVGTGFLV